MKMKTNTRATIALFVPIIIPFLVLGVLAAVIPNKVTPIRTDAEGEYVPYEIANKGFETGNLDGWRVYRIWKDENGMISFQREKSDKSLASRVVTGTYFSGNNHYNRDGNYNLGITNSDFPWNQSEERMGHLRSSDFVLGGSGMISFKLGGSKHHEFAYMSIREADTNIEVARFANPHYNDKTKAEEIYGSGYGEVAEAFLFPYYFDLTSVTDLGTKLYIMLSETSSYEWSILSADSFETYYPGDLEDVEAGFVTAKMIPAVNILPEVLGIDTADNSIKNGEFDTNYDHWIISTEGKGWGWHDSKSMRSNVNGGDGGIGILRSSAFTITPNKYFKFDWGGGLKHDKQIFVSIKEVATNIEVLRYVRRDNLSNQEGHNLDNHICSLSSLDNSKKYYAEFADNRASGWGVSYVDKVRLSNNGDPSGDRAVQILKPTKPTFDFTKEHEAEAFAVHFLEESGPICEAMSGDFTEAWEVLGAHYASLSDDAKDHFVNENASELALLAARERYLYIINKYTSLDKFVTDSGSNVYMGMYDFTSTATNDSTITIVFVIIALTLVTTGAFLIFTKRKSRIN